VEFLRAIANFKHDVKETVAVHGNRHTYNFLQNFFLLEAQELERGFYATFQFFFAFALTASYVSAEQYLGANDVIELKSFPDTTWECMSVVMVCTKLSPR